jgi:hypothetical protein
MRGGDNLVSHVSIAKLHEECLLVNKYIHMTARRSCPRCEKPGLKNWGELNDEEREVVKRLPLSAQYSLAERQANHRWCTRCWFEDRATDEHG